MLRLRISRLEGVAIAVLAIVITGVLVVKRFVRNDSAYVLTQPTDKQFEEYRKFTVARQERDDNHHGFSTPAVHAARLFRFNPNTADEATLRRLGLTDRQISNLMKYRAAGGRWRSADDFSRLYGLSAAEFERLRPYVVVEPLAGKTAGQSGSDETAHRADHRQDFVKVEKLPAGTKVNLITADTTLLKQIPGIGS